MVAPLRARGIDVSFPVWDDPAVDWSAFDLVVVRCTWDYVGRRDAFVAWAERVPWLRNPAPVLRWNTDKRYLADLAAAGLPVVPTTFVAPGEPYAAPDAAEVVVKPTVSAGARDTARHPAADAGRAAAHVAGLHAGGRTAMVQPYLDGIDAAGETALLFLGGTYSHAIRKGPLLAPDGSAIEGLFAIEEIRPREPRPEERELAEAVVAHARERFGDLLYARVDLVPGPDGAPHLIELELTEPSLFLEHDAGAAERLAAAIEAGL